MKQRCETRFSRDFVFVLRAESLDGWSSWISEKIVVVNADRFASVAYLRLKKFHLEDKKVSTDSYQPRWVPPPFLPVDNDLTPDTDGTQRTVSGSDSTHGCLNRRSQITDNGELGVFVMVRYASLSSKPMQRLMPLT